MPPKQERKQLQWIELSDFTPGIISQSQSTHESLNVPLGATGPVPGAKPGQANAAVTVGCICLPNGGIAPLPMVSSKIAPPSSINRTGVENIICGLFVTGPLQPAGQRTYPSWLGSESVIIGVETYHTNPLVNTKKFLLWDTGVVGGTVAYQNTLATIGESVAYDNYYTTMTGAQSTVNHSGAMWPVWLLSYWFMNATGSNPDWVGAPSQWLYPNVNTGGSTVYAFTNPNSASPAYAICHEGRLVLVELSQYTWNASYSVFVNESFNYTDPPQTITLGSQDETFVPENPTGIQAWGSISASELFCVKADGGGFVLQNDLNSPTITRLPGVQPTYGLSSRTAQTTLGLIYLSSGSGAWLWNGGSTAQKLSHAIDDNFYDVIVTDVFELGDQPFDQLTLDGWAADVCVWNDWVVFSNDWVYDTQTLSWWKLPPSPNIPLAHVWYQTSYDGNNLYAAPPRGTDTCMVDIYSKSTVSSTYTWGSYPIRPQSGGPNRSLSVQEVVIRAQGNGTIQVVLTGDQGTTTAGAISPSDTVTFETSPDNAQPSIQRLTSGLVAQDITITITSTGATAETPAPILYSIGIGYTDDAALVSPG